MLIYVCVYFVTGAMAASNQSTLYEYFRGDGIRSGLSDAQPQFTLNGKEITLYSGALHYFRVPSDYWRDRLRKIRAAGLIAVETYVPWNLHEPQEGKFDFGQGGTDFGEFLDIVRFVEIAKEEDLFVILRPGPYICAEWEFGGLPSWLLRYEGLKIRTSDDKFIGFVERYFGRLLELVAPLQYTRNGAIIAVQIENEYGNTKDGDRPVDTAYLEKIKEILRKNGIVELLFTSDTPSNGFSGTLPGVLATANFQELPIYELGILKEFQPNKPLMVMEYWTGWFDHWTEKHHVRTADKFGQVLEEILGFGSSFNMYMFHGGTNWGFLNGANIDGLFKDNEGFQPDVTTYDYDAPLSEAGDYTDKFYKTKEILSKYSKLPIKHPDLPKLVDRIAYPQINIIGELTLDDLVQNSETFESPTPLPMELLPTNNNNGQSYGYIVYKKNNINIPKNSILTIEGRICDTALVLIDGVLKSKIPKTNKDLDNFGYWKLKDSKLDLGDTEYKNASLEIIVENWGRVNYGKLNQFKQHKGLWQGNVLLNDSIVTDWKITPLEFNRTWIKQLSNWRKVSGQTGPRLLRAVLRVDEPRDTYVDMRDWIKGFVVVNDFVLSRYFRLGPQQTCYLPATLLRKGENDILIFEHFTPAKEIKFQKDLIFEEFVELK